MPDMLSEDATATSKPTLDLPPEGKYGLVGREDELEGLGSAFQETPVVLLTGPAGVGKTELACGFARRLLDRGDRQGGVLFTSFDYGAGLCRVLHEVGTTLQGIGFACLSQGRQREWVVEYLRQNPCLLIWDNFEYVFQYLDSSESGELVDFLQDIGEGSSYVLITGRGSAWANDVGKGYGQVELGGLKEVEARQLAGLILDGSDVGVVGLGAQCAELLNLLHGNPMSMGLVIPHLKKRTPSQLAQELLRLAQEEARGSKDLEDALECSFANMSPRTRAHLPVLALFQQRVLLDVLTFVTQGEVYVSVTGEEMGWGACRTFLREARDCGILGSIPPSVFLIHPTVSGFLRQQLAHRLTGAQIEVLEQEFVRVYADLGDYFLENLSSENTDSTVTGVLAEEANLLRALHLAETAGQWEHAQLVLQPLGQVYRMQERVLELRRLRERLLAHVGLEAEEAEKNGAIESWLYLQGTEINDAIGRLESDKAEGICHTVLRYLESLGDSAPQAQVALVYHHLGTIDQARNQYDQAEEWYRKALKINEPLGNEAESADSYQQLGSIAQSQRRYEEAEEWHRKTLEIRERLGDEAESAGECHQLGLVAEAAFEFEAALEWHHRARNAYENVGDKASAGAVYHRLGLIAQLQFDYEDATGWYQKALMGYEELGDESKGANDYYQLGVIALERYDYEEADGWHHQALQAYEKQGSEIGVANSYHQLGMVAHSQSHQEQAEEWYQKALEIFLRLKDEVAEALTWAQLGLLADHSGNYPDAVWYVAHTYEIAATHQLPMLSQVKTHLSDLRSKMGTEAFVNCWQEISDTDVLPELE